jgi:hypothetical protein
VGGAGAGAHAPPEHLLTASPLPGTTLGVLRAPLDPHGHVCLLDTPGIVADEAQAAMLRAVLRSAAEAAAGGESEGGAGAGAEVGGGGLMAARARPSGNAPALRALALLVPGGKASERPARGGLRAATHGLPIVRLAPGRSLFLGGLARIDYAHPDPACHLLLSVASRLPPHATATARAEDLWGAHAEGPRAAAAAAVAPGKPLPLLWPRHGPLAFAGSLSLRACLNANQLATVRATAVVDAQRSGAAATAVGDGGEGGSMALPSLLFAGEAGGGGLEGLEPPHGEGGWEEEEKEEEGGGAGAGYGGARRLSRLPPGALAPNASRSATLQRRRERLRPAVVDVALPGLGWVAVTPVEVQGMVGWARTMQHGVLRLHVAEGVRAHARAPLLPYTAVGTGPKEWVS